MHFVEKTDFKLSVTTGNVSPLSTYKIKCILLLPIDFATDFSHCS